MDLNHILQKILEAHGGLDLWNNLEAIEAEISACGFLFTAKRRPTLNHEEVGLLDTLKKRISDAI